MNKKIKLEGTCYVLLQINTIHPITYIRHDLIWYPERYLNLLECVQYRPYIKSIVTENAWLISCYDRNNVKIWHKEYGWVSPNNQTYGASVNQINSHLLGIKQTIPSVMLDGGDAIKKLIDKLKDDRENYK